MEVNEFVDKILNTSLTIEQTSIINELLVNHMIEERLKDMRHETVKQVKKELKEFTQQDIKYLLKLKLNVS